jgi:Fe-S oxidoreductase
MFGDVALHRRLLNIRYSGVLHLMIFSSFLVLLTAIVQAFGSGLFPGFSLKAIGGETWIAMLQEVFSLIILCGLAMASWQRFVIKPKRFNGSKKLDATIIYVLATTIVATMLLEFASDLIAKGATSNSYRPVSSAIAALMHVLGATPAAADIIKEAFYWLHIIAVLLFLIYIPGSKHRHMFLAAPNIFFRPLTPKGQLPPPPKKDGVNSVVETFDDFTWKDHLDVLSCTECGRCQAVCPAYAAGKPLSPKSLIMDLRDGMLANEGLLDKDIHFPIAGGIISEATLWSCTTCRACMEVCPVHIEHVPKIVQLRRSLVEKGAVEPMLQETLTNFQSQGNSFGKPPKQRARWTKNLSFKIKDARKDPVDILWFVGDFASFDPRVQELTVMVAEMLNMAGVDFGIIYDSERNSGNDIRRAGDEGLFELLAQHNIEAINACEFNKIMTTDPHTLNALGTEYEALGAHYNVVHYSQLLWELIRDKKLTPKTDTNHVVTYHDPCYLGRYNGAYDSPRDLIAALGHTLHDMGRCRENSFCCGAGGGRIWMDDAGAQDSQTADNLIPMIDVSEQERPSENRIREAIALGNVTHFVVSCPKDVVMYTAAIQAVGVEDQIVIMDLAELVYDTVK